MSGDQEIDLDDGQLMDRDLQMMRADAVKALAMAKRRVLTEDEIMAAAYVAGVANDVYKELRK